MGVAGSPLRVSGTPSSCHMAGESPTPGFSGERGHYVGGEERAPAREDREVSSPARQEAYLPERAGRITLQAPAIRSTSFAHQTPVMGQSGLCKRGCSQSRRCGESHPDGIDRQILPARISILFTKVRYAHPERDPRISFFSTSKYIARSGLNRDLKKARSRLFAPMFSKTG